VDGKVIGVIPLMMGEQNWYKGLNFLEYLVLYNINHLKNGRRNHYVNEAL
jgi:hypothetical protein